MSIRRFVYGLLLVLVMSGDALAQSPIARFVYEEAEEAYAKQDYSTTLIKLEKAEKEFGKINPPILYLRIMSRNEILKASVSLDFDNLNRLRADCARYLKDYGEMESVRDQAREVYKVSTTLDKYPATKEAYLKEEEAKRQAEEARLETVRRQAAAWLKDNLVLVKGGCYQMGNTFGGLFSSEGEKDEKPVHEVCLNDFYIGKYEVTVGEFREFVNASGYKTEAETSGGCYVWTGKLEQDSSKNWKSPGFSQTDKDPVVCVSWNDANKYIDWKGRQTGMTLRLPTEAEWEYAARSGGKKERYSGGDDLDSVAWYGSNSGSKTHPVGEKRPNGLGIYDMTGNVWEWTSDWYDENYYGSSPKDSPKGPSSGKYNVLRGGSWNDIPANVRASDRDGFGPSNRSVSFGFRLAAPAP